MGGDHEHVEKKCDWSHKGKLGQGLDKDEVGQAADLERDVVANHPIHHDKNHHEGEDSSLDAVFRHVNLPG